MQVRFYHESSINSQKSHFLPEIDFMDIEPRREEVPTARGKPTMMQLPLQPAYASSIHKVQSLTIKHTVHGCLEALASSPLSLTDDNTTKCKSASWARPVARRPWRGARCRASN